MKVFPLKSMNLSEAQEYQFKLVDTITKYFLGDEILTQGDLGVVAGFNKPKFTKKVEQVLADFFDAEEALLVRGAGTGSIQLSLYSALNSGDTVVVHKAPIYPTTKVTLEKMGTRIVQVDFNDKEQLSQKIEAVSPKVVLVQYTRQKPSDKYNMEDVIRTVKQVDKNICVICDDNYAAMKVHKIGSQLGADISCFSSFKLLGPEGVGVIVGSKEMIDRIEGFNYSGGSKVQGHEAKEVLQGLIYAPVSLAISSKVVEELNDFFNSTSIDGVKGSYIVNAQSKVLLVELNKPIAKSVIAKSNEFGVATFPIGAESKYEFVPMFYRVSSTFNQSNASIGDYMIRINPMRGGAKTIIRILKSAISEVSK